MHAGETKKKTTPKKDWFNSILELLNRRGVWVLNHTDGPHKYYLNPVTGSRKVVSDEDHDGVQVQQWWLDGNDRPPSRKRKK